MNCIIKIRGKSVFNDEWIYSELVYRINYPETLPPIQIICSGIKENTVGQFTGLFDKNGKEIYEGDILLVGNDGYKNIYKKVVLKDGCFGYVGETNGEILPFCHYNVMEEIVGNIYDNPELINEKL